MLLTWYRVTDFTMEDNKVTIETMLMIGKIIQKLNYMYIFCKIYNFQDQNPSPNLTKHMVTHEQSPQNKVLIDEQIQLSAVIMQSNIPWYCTHHCRNSGRLSIRGWIHKKTLHTLPWRASYGVSFMSILEIIDRVITAPHCTFLLMTESIVMIVNKV